MDVIKPHLGHALCLYDNVADSQTELSFSKGTKLLIFQQNPVGYSGWWLCGYEPPLTTNGPKQSFRIGYAPANRLRLLASCQKCTQQLHSSNEPLYNAPPSDSTATAPPLVPVHKQRPAEIAPALQTRSREERAHVVRSQALDHEPNGSKLRPSAIVQRPTLSSSSSNSLRKCNSLELLDSPPPTPEDEYLQLGDVGAYRITSSVHPNTQSKLPVPVPRPNAQPSATVSGASKPTRQITARKLPSQQTVNGASQTAGASNADQFLPSSTSKEALDKRSADSKYANETSPLVRCAVFPAISADPFAAPQNSNYCNVEFVAPPQRVPPVTSTSSTSHPPSLPRHGAAARNPTTTTTTDLAPVLPTRDHKAYDTVPVSRPSADTAVSAPSQVVAVTTANATLPAAAAPSSTYLSVSSTHNLQSSVHPNQKSQPPHQPPAPNYAQKPKLKASQTSISSAGSDSACASGSAVAAIAATATGPSSGEDEGRSVLGDLPNGTRLREDTRASSSLSVSGASGAGGRERVACAAGTSLSLPVGAGGAPAAAQSPAAKRALPIGMRSASAHNLSVAVATAAASTSSLASAAAARNASAAALENCADYEEIDVGETCVDETACTLLNQKPAGRKGNALKICRLDSEAALSLFAQHYGALQESVSQILALVRPKWKEYANLMRVLPEFRAALSSVCVHLDELVSFAEGAQANCMCLVNDPRLAKQFERSLFLMRQAQERLGADAVPLDRTDWRWEESEARSSRAADLLYRLDCLFNATRDLLLNLRTLNALVVGNAKLLFTGQSAQRSGTDSNANANAHSGSSTHASSPALGCYVKALSSQNLSLSVSPLSETPGFQRTALTSSSCDLSARPPAARSVGGVPGTTYMASLMRGGRLRDTAPLLAYGLSTSTGHLNLTVDKPPTALSQKQPEQSDANPPAAAFAFGWGVSTASTAGTGTGTPTGSQPNLASRSGESSVAPEKLQLSTTANSKKSKESNCTLLSSISIDRKPTAGSQHKGAGVVEPNAAADRVQVQAQAQAQVPPTSTASTVCAVAVDERQRSATFSTPSARLAPALESALAACDAALSAQHELLHNNKGSPSTSTSISSALASAPSSSTSASTASSSASTSASASAGTSAPALALGSSRGTLQQSSVQQTSVPPSLPVPTPAELTLAHNQLASLVDALMALLDECAPPAAFIERTRLVLLQAYKLIHLTHRISSSASSASSAADTSQLQSQSQSQQAASNKPLSWQSAASSSAARTRQLRQPDASQRHQLQAREQELEEQLRALVAAARDAAATFPAQEQRVALARAGQTCVLLSTGLRNTILAALK